MNIYSIIEEIEKVDDTFQDRISPRRQALKDFMSSGSKIALSALPFALGSLFNKAYGQEKVKSEVIDVLNYALSLEHLEYHFYQKGLSTSGLVKDKDKISIIRNHEMEHVKFLTDTIRSSGGTPVAAGTYDFTAGGAFADIFSNYDTFLHVAQAFEDTGVRAYKGQANKLDSQPMILQAALQIHSTEARHAAHIRFARRVNGYNNSVKPWIVGNDNTTGTPYEAVYKGEENETQVIFGINDIGGKENGKAGTTSFDEPLDKDDVLKIVKPFIVG